ncbi:MAG: LamG domain-containing protein [Bacteroidota bacterium]
MTTHENIALLVLVAAPLAACAPGPVEIAVLDTKSPLFGMIAHWPFDDGEGNMATDRSGNRHHGTVGGATWTTAGRFGGALHFESGNEVTVPNFPHAGPAFSVALWVRPPAQDLGTSTYATLVSTEIVFAGGWEINAMLSPIDSRYQMGYYNGPGDSDYFTFDCRCVTPLQWTHIASVVDATAGTLSFYKDGVYQGQSVVTEPIKPGTDTLYFGRWQMTGRLFAGDLDDVVIYDRALEPADVAALAKAPAPIPP